MALARWDGSGGGCLRVSETSPAIPLPSLPPASSSSSSCWYSHVAVDVLLDPTAARLARLPPSASKLSVRPLLVVTRVLPLAHTHAAATSR